MKKVFLLAITTSMGLGAFAQAHKTNKTTLAAKSEVVANTVEFNRHAANVAAKTTAVGDTDVLSNCNYIDSPAYIYSFPNDTGYTSGTDAFGDKGFAERYDFTAADSTVQVLGVLTFFTGNISKTTTKTVDFSVWSPAARTAVTGVPNWYNSGLPGTVLASLTGVPVLALGIDTSAGHTAGDSVKAFPFGTPTAYLTTSFFVGYTATYNWSSNLDTFGVRVSMDGDRTSPLYTTSGTDSIINNVSVTQFSDGTWNDNAFFNTQQLNDYFLFPIVKIGAGHSTAVGITNRSFTFFGTYPNPANSSTNVRFSVAAATDVTISVIDMAGRTMNTIAEKNISAGEHTIPVSTSDLAAGNYLVVIRTTNGGIATQLSVIK